MRAEAVQGFVCGLIALGSVPGAASAQWGASSLDREHVDRVSPDLELAFSADLGFYAGHLDEGLVDANLLSLTPTFAVGARLFDLIGLEFVVPTMFGHVDPEDTTFPFVDDSVHSDFRSGNPYLAAYFSPRWVGRGVEVLFRVGVAVAFPGARVDRTSTLGFSVSRANYLMALGSRGTGNPFWNRAEHFGFAFPVGAEAWLAGGLVYLAADMAVSYELYDGPDGSGTRPANTGVVQAAIEGGAEPFDWLRISLRVSGVGEFEDGVPIYAGPMARTGSDDDDFQMALEPRVTIAHGPLFGQLGLLMNLDEPFGVFGGDSDYVPGTYCFRLLVGGRL